MVAVCTLCGVFILRVRFRIVLLHIDIGQRRIRLITSSVPLTYLKDCSSKVYHWIEIELSLYLASVAGNWTLSGWTRRENRIQLSHGQCQFRKAVALKLIIKNSKGSRTAIPVKRAECSQIKDANWWNNNFLIFLCPKQIYRRTWHLTLRMNTPYKVEVATIHI